MESGIREDGSWVPAFPGQRPPFQPGNELALRHGAKAVVALRPRAQELADEIRERLPVYSEADEIVVQTLAMRLAQLERVDAAIAERDFGQSAAYLMRHFGTLANSIDRACRDLGLSPLARSELGLNIARSASERLEAYLGSHRSS